MRIATWCCLLAGLGGAVLGAASTGCLKAAAFACSGTDDCGPGGVCEPEGFCSFIDGSCPSGRRFGELAGAYGNTCVGGDAADGGVDTSVDGSTGTCFGAGAYTVCLDVPADPVTLTGTINTDTDPRCAAMQPAGWIAAGQAEACFIVGMEIDVPAPVAVRAGSRPLVLVAATSITISGTLDVSSRRSGIGGNVVGVGPGSPSAACVAASGTPQNSGGGGGGGAGGSFMTAGGNGAIGNAGGSTAGTAAPASAMAPTVLRGGCPGQRGGNGGGGNVAGTSGAGGGAVFLAAGATITISGAINASGAGGAGGGVRTGGSGGGSGGMIVLHAPTITATAGRVFANGGGASQGGDSNTSGANGTDAAADPTSPAAGGAIGTAGGPGGAGFALGSNAASGDPGDGTEGGGGGGGGGGFILSNRPLTGATVSPAESLSGS